MSNLLIDTKQIFKNNIINLVKDNENININGDKIDYINIQYDRKTCGTNIEEYARCFLINDLIKNLGYKSEFLYTEKEYQNIQIGRQKKKVPNAYLDLVLYHENKKDIYYFIEVKDFESFDIEDKDIESQLFNLAKLETEKNKSNIDYLVYYTVEYFNNEIKPKMILIDYSKFRTYQEWEDSGFEHLNANMVKNYGNPKIKQLKNDGLSLKRNIDEKELTKIRKQLHNVLWSGGGTDDNKIFTTLTKIILTKIFDEDNTKKGDIYNFQYFQKKDGSYEDYQECYERINEIYKKALEKKLNFSKSEAEKSEMIDFKEFNINLFIFTVQTLQSLSFTNPDYKDNTDLLGDFFEGIINSGFKQSKGQFFTPVPIIDFMLELMEIDKINIEKFNKNQTLTNIIDPSCGSGSFLIQSMKFITKKMIEAKEKGLIEDNSENNNIFNITFPEHKPNIWAKQYIYGNDINFDLGTSVKVNMVLHGDGVANIHIKDGLIPNKNIIEGTFDVLVSNPPFSVSLPKSSMKQIEKLYNFSSRTKSENLFIERYYHLLKEDGIMGIVIPETVFDTKQFDYIRYFIFKHFNIKKIVSLPSEITFAPYTPVKTSILIATKKNNRKIIEWENKFKEGVKEYRVFQKLSEKYIKNKIDDNELEILKNLLWLENINDISIKKLNYYSKIDMNKNDYEKLNGENKNHYINFEWVLKYILSFSNNEIDFIHADKIGYKKSTRKTLKTTSELPDILNKYTRNQGDYSKSFRIKEKEIINTDDYRIDYNFIEMFKGNYTHPINYKNHISDFFDVFFAPKDKELLENLVNEDSEFFEAFNYVEIGNVDKNNNITYTTIENINEPNDDNQKVIQKILKGDIFKAKKGDILIAKTRPYLNKIILIDEETENYYYTRAFIVLRKKENIQIDNKVFYYFIKSKLLSRLVSVSRQGKSYPTLDPEDLKLLYFSNKEIKTIENFDKNKIETVELKIKRLKNKLLEEKENLMSLF